MVTRAEVEGALESFFNYSTTPNIQGVQAHLLVPGLLLFWANNGGLTPTEDTFTPSFNFSNPRNSQYL